MLLHRNANKSHDVGMLVLLQNAALLQEGPFLFVRQRYAAGLHCYLLVGTLETSLVDVAEVTLAKKVNEFEESQGNVTKIQRSVPSFVKFCLDYSY